MDRTCTLIHDRLLELASGPIASPAAEHLLECVPCSRLVERERRLVSLLDALPAAPMAAFGPPGLPSATRGRVLQLAVPRWLAAVAAAAVFTAVAWRFAADDLARIRVDLVVDVAGAPPPVDERLLALTGGAEAVAMRRPTESR